MVTEAICQLELPVRSHSHTEGRSTPIASEQVTAGRVGARKILHTQTGGEDAQRQLSVRNRFKTRHGDPRQSNLGWQRVIQQRHRQRYS